MTISRRILLAGTACASVASFRIARAQTPQFTYKLAHNQPAASPLHTNYVAAAEAIKADTDGKFVIQVFPSSQLGSDTDTLSQLRSGAVEFFSLSPLILSTLVPKASISGMAFAFPDYAAVWKAMDGDVGTYVRGQIEKSGLYAQPKIFDNGFRQVTSSNRPIKTPEDFKGFKIRVPVSPLWTSLFKAFDASPTSINFNEVYSALQTRVVDGQENPLNIAVVAKLYEVQKYCSLTNHMWDGYWLLANRRAWDKLPADIRAAATKRFDEYAVKERADMEKLNNSAQSDLEAKGLVFNTTQQAPFRDALKKAGFYTEWQSKFGTEAWSVLEHSVGNLS